MNPSFATVQAWLEIVKRHRKLAEFGFKEDIQPTQSSRIREVRFSSKDFVFVVGVDLLVGEQYGRFLDRETNAELPSPHLALCYFLPNVEALIARYAAAHDDDQEFQIAVELYRENQWLLRSKAWTRHEGFLAAIQTTNEWMWKEMQTGVRSLGRWEFERMLHMQRDSAVSIPT